MLDRFGSREPAARTPAATHKIAALFLRLLGLFAATVFVCTDLKFSVDCRSRQAFFAMTDGGSETPPYHGGEAGDGVGRGL